MSRKKSEFLSSLGVLWEIWKALVNEVLDLGGTDEDLRRIQTDATLRRQIAELIMTSVKSVTCADLIPQGWTVVEDVDPSDFQVEDLEFISCLNEGEDCIDGKTMRVRAVTLKANLGLFDGKRILDQQDKVPVEIRGKYIFLPGTLLRDSVGDLHVAYLYWDDERWCLNFYWLDRGWNAYDRLARRK